MELESDWRYLVRRKELNYISQVLEFKLVEESGTSYKFEFIKNNKSFSKWFLKKDFEEDYEIIEILQ